MTARKGKPTAGKHEVATFLTALIITAIAAILVVSLL